MQAETICTNDIEGLDDNTLIPVEILSCDVSHRSHSQDALSIVELGKQLLLNAKNGDTEMVRNLMCRGAPFTTDWLGTSALHLAAQNNHIDTAEVLLRAGISRDARTKVDRTPLHMAAYEGHHQMAQLLLNYGADVDSRDMLKMTPLHWAVEQEYAEVMQILLEHGADPNVTSKFDKTPISLALEHDRLDLVDILHQEREIINHAINHQMQSHSTELEVATQNLIQLETSRDEEQGNTEFQDDLPLPIHSHQKTKIPQVGKKSRMVFQQIISSTSNGEQKTEIKQVNEIINTNNLINNKKRKDIPPLSGIKKQFRLLEAHGITMIPVDDESSIVENAMESGRTVVLTEAGKLALNLTKGTPIGVKRLQLASRKGSARKVIAIRADQILNQTLPLMPKGPNILKRGTGEKTGKLYVSPISNNTINSTLSPSKTFISTQGESLNSSKKINQPIILQLDDNMGEIIEGTPEDDQQQLTEIELLNRQLEEARKEIIEYRQLLQKKEEEAELYKQQLRHIRSQKTFK